MRNKSLSSSAFPWFAVSVTLLAFYYHSVTSTNMAVAFSTTPSFYKLSSSYRQSSSGPLFIKNKVSMRKPSLDINEVDEVTRQAEAALAEAEEALAAITGKDVHFHQQSRRTPEDNELVIVDNNIMVDDELEDEKEEEEGELEEIVENDDELVIVDNKILDGNDSPDADINKEIELALKNAEAALAATSPSFSATQLKQAQNKDSAFHKAATQINASSLFGNRSNANIIKVESANKHQSDAIASAVSSIFFGAILGAIFTTTSTYGEILDLLQIDEISPTITPTIFATILTSISYILALQEDTIAGKITRSTFGSITKTTTKSITTKATNVVNDAVNEVTSIPNKVQTAVHQKAQQTVDEIKSVPTKVQNAAVDAAHSAVEEIKSVPNKVAHEAQTVMTNTVDGVKQEIHSIPTKVKGAAVHVANQAVEEIKLVPNKLADGAKEVVTHAARGVVDEINAMPTKLNMKSTSKGTAEKASTEQEVQTVGTNKELVDGANDLVSSQAVDQSKKVKAVAVAPVEKKATEELKKTPEHVVDSTTKTLVTRSVENVEGSARSAVNEMKSPSFFVKKDTTNEESG